MWCAGTGRASLLFFYVLFASVLRTFFLFNNYTNSTRIKKTIHNASKKQTGPESRMRKACTSKGVSSKATSDPRANVACNSMI